MLQYNDHVRACVSVYVRVCVVCVSATGRARTQQDGMPSGCAQDPGHPHQMPHGVIKQHELECAVGHRITQAGHALGHHGTGGAQ